LDKTQVVEEVLAISRDIRFRLRKKKKKCNCVAFPRRKTYEIENGKAVTLGEVFEKLCEKKIRKKVNEPRALWMSAQ